MGARIQLQLRVLWGGLGTVRGGREWGVVGFIFWGLCPEAGGGLGMTGWLAC